MEQTQTYTNKKLEKRQNLTNTLSENYVKKMPSGTYLVDMDGVLFDFVSGFNKQWLEKHPHYPVLDIKNQTHFFIEDNFPKNYKPLIEKIIEETPTFFEDLEPIPGALEGLLKLAETNKVFICTSPNIKNDYCALGKIRSIKKHLGDSWVRKTIITKDKTIVHGDYLIDDKPEITGNFNPSWKHILYDQPYNKYVQTNLRFNWEKGLFQIGFNTPEFAPTQKPI